MMGMFGNDDEWKRRWQRVYDAGVTNIDLHFAFFEIIIPLTFICLDHLLVPFFVSRTMCFYIQSYATQTIVTRYSFLAYFLFFKLFDGLKIVFKYLVGVYNQVRDSRYLIGTELTNR